MNRRKRVGPRIEPGGTPDRTLAYLDRPLSLIMACWRHSRYDSNHRIELVLFVHVKFLYKNAMVYSIKGFAKVYKKCSYNVAVINTCLPMVNKFFKSRLAATCMFLSKTRLTFM